MFADIFLDELRARLPVSEVVRQRVQLKKAGREWVGLSPFNKESTPSFTVNDNKGFFHDFSSGKHGDIFAFVMETEGLPFPEAVEKLAALAGVTMPDGREASASRSGEGAARTERAARIEREHAQEVLKQRHKARHLWKRSLIASATIAETYLRARGYSGPIPATVKFLSASDDYPPALIAAYGIATEPEPGALAITDDAVCGVHLIKLKADGSDRLRDPKAKPKITIGLDIVVPIMVAAPNDLMGLCIAEGIEDAINAHQATGLGAWAAGGAGRLPALADAIPNYIETVTLPIDDNEAGRTNTNKLAARVRTRGIEVLATLIGNLA
jgi:hypothetical protein